MQTYLKTRPVWIQVLLFIGMAFGIVMVISMITVFIISGMTGLSMLELSNPAEWDTSKPEMVTYIRAMILAQFLGLFFIPSLLMAYFSDPKPLQYLGLKPVVKPIYWLLGIGALLLAIPFVDFIGSLNRDMNFGGLQNWAKELEEEATKTLQMLLGRNTVPDLLINLLFIAVFAGVGEELFFRGILQRLFIKWTKDPWMGIVIAAFIFSFFHFQFFGFFPRFLLGILLGAVYWYSGSLWPAIIAHTVYNGFFIVVAYFNPEMVNNTEASVIDKSNLAWVGFVSAILIGIIIWQMKKHSTTTYTEVYADDDMKPTEKDLTF